MNFKESICFQRVLNSRFQFSWGYIHLICGFNFYLCKNCLCCHIQLMKQLNDSEGEAYIYVDKINKSNPNLCPTQKSSHYWLWLPKVSKPFLTYVKSITVEANCFHRWSLGEQDNVNKKKITKIICHFILFKKRKKRKTIKKKLTRNWTF